jgi:hypothetical protein
VVNEACAQETGLVADPAQIIVWVRQDRTVAMSTDALFRADGAMSGLVSIPATGTR